VKIIHLKAAIQKSLSNIGKRNGSAPPESTSNTFGAAYELFVASELRSAANKRYDVAKEAAKDAGVIDEAKAVEGAEIATNSNEYFDGTMKQASASSTIDKTKLKSTLMVACNLNEKQADDIIAAASKPRKGAVTIGFSLKG
jgi:hypothetical protein